MNIEGQACTFAIMLSEMRFIKGYPGRKYNFEYYDSNILFKDAFDS